MDKYYLKVLDKAPIGVCILKKKEDGELYLEYANRYLYDVLNYDFSNRLNFKLVDVFPDIINQDLPTVYSRSLISGQSVSITVKYEGSFGKPGEYYLDIIPLDREYLAVFVDSFANKEEKETLKEFRGNINKLLK